MRSKTVWAACVALAVPLIAGCGGGGYKTQTVTVTERDTNVHGFVAHFGPPKAKLGPQGPQNLVPGDTVTLANDLLNSSKQKVGETNGTCLTTRPGSFQTATTSCSATATLNGGSLTLAAAGKVFAASFTGAIAGGTGKYAGAGGTFTIKQSSSGPSQDTYHIQIPQK